MRLRSNTSTRGLSARSEVSARPRASRDGRCGESELRGEGILVDNAGSGPAGDHPSHGVLELAHVSWPQVVSQYLEGSGRDTAEWEARFRGGDLKIVLDQTGDVVCDTVGGEEFRAGPTKGGSRDPGAGDRNGGPRWWRR